MKTQGNCHSSGRYLSCYSPFGGGAKRAVNKSPGEIRWVAGENSPTDGWKFRLRVRPRVGLLPRVSRSPSRGAIASALLLAILLWGGNNVGIKVLVGFWPPVFVGASRFLAAGLLLGAVLRWTSWFGTPHPLPRETRLMLWWRGGLSLAAYIVAFNLAVRFTAVSHVAVYLGAVPIWALLWEEWTGEAKARRGQCYSAAALGFLGVLVLFLPALRRSQGNLWGEILALAASFLWIVYGRQCRALRGSLSGIEMTAQTMWRAGFWLLPYAVVETVGRGVVWRTDLALIQAYCIIVGGVVCFATWASALRHWQTSEVFLFNNLIPLSTSAWAFVCLRESVSPTFWPAMVLVLAGVTLGQTDWSKMLRILRRKVD